MIIKRKTDIYDWLHIVSSRRWRRRCPKCGNDDVKYAIHSKEIAFCELSVRCNSCKHEDSGDNSGKDVERMVREWHDRGGRRMDLKETRIPIAGNLRCCLESVAIEYEGKEVSVGYTSECKHCKARFVLDENKKWRRVDEN